MVRLIVEEEGKRRAFRLGDGALRIGSGAEARLKLNDPEVAAAHVDLLVDGDTVRLRPLPDTPAPIYGGGPLEGETALAPCEAFTLGSVRLWVDDGEGPIPDPHDEVAGTVGTAERARLRSQAIVHAVNTRELSVVRRRRPRNKKSLPAWGVPVMILGAVAGGLAIVMYGLDRSADAGAGPVDARLVAARDLIRAGSYEHALLRLDSITMEDVSAEQRQVITDLRETIAEAERVAQQHREDTVATKYLDVMLKRYEKKHLQGKPEPSRVRLFLKRCAYFEDRWSGFSEISWVHRQKTRFEGLVDPDAPGDFEDVSWEIHCLVAGKPRDYREAFELLDDFDRRAVGDEALAPSQGQAELLRETLIAERAEYAADRLQQARYEYQDRDDPNKAVWWLMNSITGLGDKSMEDEAAEVLVKFPNAEGHLKGYRESYPDMYDRALENAIVRRFARAKKLL